MRDTCGICSGLYTADEEEMDRLILKSPVHGDTSTTGSSPPSSNKKSKLPSIVESKETIDENEPVVVTHVGTLVEDEEEEEELDEKKDEEEPRDKEVPGEEIRTPLSSDFTAVRPEDEEEEEEEEDDVALTSRPQRDFDDNPTPLYLTLMRKDWEATIVRSGKAPEEVSTWIYRKEHDGSGTLRWKLLPIHAAIIFGAPVSVLKAFLTVDPSTALAKDDQGMIPLHLAVRMGCYEGIIRALARAAPKSVLSRDRKGRTPRDLALRQTGTVRELLLAALDGCAVKPVATPTVVVEEPPPAREEAEDAAPVVQQRSALVIPTSPVSNIMMTPTAAPISPIVQYKPDPALAARVHLLELQLERSNALNADVTAQLEKLIAAENRLRADHAALLDNAAAATNTYVEAETANKAVITNLVNQVGDLQGKVTTLTCEKAEVEASLAHIKEQMDVERGEHRLQVLDLERALNTTTAALQEAQESEARLATDNEQLQRTLEHKSAEMLSLRETIAAHEIKIEEVTLSEQELAWKVSSLQETIKNLPDPVEIDRQIEGLENEKKELKSTVHKLSVKLYKVVGFLDEMVQEQDAIIAESLTAGTATMNNDGENSNSSSAVGSGTTTSAAESSLEQDDRQKLLSNVTGMKEQIGAIIESVLGNMPDYRVSDEEDEAEADEA